MIKLRPPAWLIDSSADDLARMPFPRQDLLEDSLFYPACGFDGRPVAFLHHQMWSFVYVVYGWSEDQVAAEFRARGFRGYEPLFSRLVERHELSPRGRNSFSLHSELGNPHPSRDWDRRFFCRWWVLEKQIGLGDDLGPRRFSFMHLCADGLAAYQTLYPSNAVSPAAIAVIQPGTGYGGNWTDFNDPDQILARSVRESGDLRPRWLLFGGYGHQGWYKSPCWPEYAQFVGWLGGRAIGIWKRD